MKNLLKFLPIALIALSFASCGKEDWTCTCADTITGFETTSSLITGATKKSAKKECDQDDVLILNVGIDCELEE